MNNKRQRGSELMPWSRDEATGVAKDHNFTDANHSTLEKARIVVGIDFGTTFSGFAYALASEPEKVYTFYDWSCQAAAGAKPYCKTQTSLWYVPGQIGGTFELKNWGWPAYVNHSKALQVKHASVKIETEDSGLAASLRAPTSTRGHFLTQFKLHLAPDSSPELLIEKLPEGLRVERVISDYLKHLSDFILKELKCKFGSIIVKKDVQWCLTVPAIWNDRAKQTMLNCCQMAGLVQGQYCQDRDASPPPIVPVLEPEAASVFCQTKLKDNQLQKGSKFLVVDAGGGTVDLVVHEKVDNSGVRVKEIARSTGGLCGGTFVDKAFKNHLLKKIDCLEKFSVDYPATMLTLNGLWENLKCSFDGQPDSYDLELPAKLASAWEAHAKARGKWREGSHYDEVVITGEDMKVIFDGEVNKILKLIEDQLAFAPNVEAIMVVGGFSNSPYLMKRIRDTFSTHGKQIMSPTDPGSAVCQGAVAFGALGADIMMSRKSRKTYGICTRRTFRKGDPPSFLILNDDGEALCDNKFCVFVRIGDDVPVEHSVSHHMSSDTKGAAAMCFDIHSTSDPEPAFVTDPRVAKEGSYVYHLPLEAQRMNCKASVKVTMYFGRTRVEVFVEPKNFTGEKKSLLSVVFQRDLF